MAPTGLCVEWIRGGKEKLQEEGLGLEEGQVKEDGSGIF